MIWNLYYRALEPCKRKSVVDGDGGGHDDDDDGDDGGVYFSKPVFYLSVV